MKHTYAVWVPNSLKLLVVCFDNANNVPTIKALQQRSGKPKIEKIDDAFSSDSFVPIPGNIDLQGFMR